MQTNNDEFVALGADMDTIEIAFFAFALTTSGALTAMVLYLFVAAIWGPGL